LITDELARTAEVHIWHPQAPELHPSALPLISYSPTLELEPSVLSAYDLMVYNMGNYLPFHRQIFEISQKAPGIVILHDFVMHHFFAGYYFQYLKNQREYQAAMTRHYGERGKAVANESCAGTRQWVWETSEVLQYPFFEEAMRGAWAVVVHSDFFRESVAARFSGPVKKLGLAYGTQAEVAVCKRQDLGIPEDRTLIVTVGHVNPNKCIHSVIEALGRDPEIRRNVLYVVVGPYDEVYRRRLDEQVRKYNLENIVRFTGYASDEHLKSYLEHSDLCVNLRYPSTEGASASAIEEMMHGKPVVVTDTGFYSELPDDCVRKVNPRNDHEQLPRVLRDLVLDRHARQDMGSRAKSYANANFRADTYARGIVELAEELLDAKPLLAYADRIGDILADMGVCPETPIVDTVSRISHELLCGPELDGAGAKER
jgi:glycosyltransferase involved in cell wall biosynthesis